jgi:acetyl esterase/lipase
MPFAHNDRARWAFPFSRDTPQACTMIASPPQVAQRVAGLRLRAPSGPLHTRVWWPRSAARDSTSGLLMFFVDATVTAAPPDRVAAWLRELSSRAGFVVVAVPCEVLAAGAPGVSLSSAMTAVEWAAEHARELEADPDRLVVGGTGAGAALAAAAALTAQDQRWPPIARQLLIELDLAGNEQAVLGMPAEDVAPATMFAFGRVSDDAARYAARLRRASVGVDEIRHDAADPPDGLVAELARALT